MASCLSECAVTSAASISITTRPPWVGAPAWSQTRSRAAARAVVDRRQRVVGVRGQGRDQPRHRRVRGDRAEHPGLGAQHRDIAGGVPAQRDRDRQIQHDLARVMRGQRAPPRPEPGRELLASPLRRAVSTSSAPPACDTSDSPPAITDSQGRRSLSFTRGVPLNSVRSGLDNHDQTALSRHFRAFGAACRLQDQPR